MESLDFFSSLLMPNAWHNCLNPNIEQRVIQTEQTILNYSELNQRGKKSTIITAKM